MVNSESAVIFIIDDQPANLRVITNLLRSSGFKVLVAKDGESGIKKIEKVLPDLILLDILMPGIDGFETCKRLKTSPQTKHIPVIFMTALSDNESKIKGLQMGAVDYLTKPFEQEEILARIKIHLHLQKLNQELRLKNELLKQQIREIEKKEIALTESKKRLKTIINTDVKGIIVVDQEGKILFVNPATEKLFKRDSKTMLEETFGIPLVLGKLTELEIPQSPGKLRKVQMSVVEIDWENQPAYLVSLIDVTEQRKLEEKLRILYLASEQSPASIVITDAQGNIQYVNPKFEEVSGYKKEEVLGKNPRILKSGSTSSEEYRKMWETITSGKEWVGEFHNQKKTGELYWEKALISPILDSTGIITHFVAVKEDITVKKEQEQLLQYQATYDNLTNIPNRAFALQKLEADINYAKKTQKKLGLMFVDLDHFKDVNDSLGHEFGDELLKETAQRLQNVLRKTDLVARLGGDEFLILIPEVENPIDLQKIAAKIIHSLQKAFHIKGYSVFVSASVGITIFPEDGNTAKILMRNADTAMYDSKRSGRNTFSFFTPAMNRAVLNKIKVEKNLINALKNNEFQVFYQPVIHLNSGQIVSAEALLRWYNQELGYISPDRFIPIAEETGFIVDLGQWLLSFVCREAANWQKHHCLSVAINLSPRQFRDKNLINYISDALRESKLSPYSLHLEITENLLLDDIPLVSECLIKISQMNIGLSLDDFGTGYSSLSYLRKFPFQILKIDKSFITDLTTNIQTELLVKAIIAMAKSLNLKVIAEGIETKEQLELLKTYGCDYGQGYLFSKPLSSLDFRLFLEKGTGQVSGVR